MKNTNSIRKRVFRFLDERFRLRERPAYVPELLVWGLIVILATWPMFSVAAAIETLR